MKANHCLMLLGLCAIVADVKAHGQKCSSRTIRDGIPMPSRRAMLSLNTFKQKVVGAIWKPLYFGTTTPREDIFFNSEFAFKFSPDGRMLHTNYSGALPNGTCVDSSLQIEGTGSKRVFSSKAEFVSDTYGVFFSSDPEDYVFDIECITNKPVRRCPTKDFWIQLLVKNADRQPLHRALYDLYRATCLTLDTTLTSANFRFLFMYGENPCPGLEPEGKKKK